MVSLSLFSAALWYSCLNACDESGLGVSFQGANGIRVNVAVGRYEINFGFVSRSWLASATFAMLARPSSLTIATLRAAVSREANPGANLNQLT